MSTLQRIVRTTTTTAPEVPDGTGLLGPNFLEFMVLALGAAMFVGNVLALVRPRPGGPAGRGAPAPGAQRAPVVRSLVMAGIGLVAAVWALASLVA